MKDRTLNLSDVLIVTDDNVEATVILEVLLPIELNRVQHLRMISDAAHLLLDSGFRPQLSVLSHSRYDSGFDSFAMRLQTLNSSLLLIDAPDAIAKELNARFLRRPFLPEDVALEIWRSQSCK